jgi:hypothetical protein
LRGHVRKRGKAWSIIVDLGLDADNKRKQKWVGGFATKKEAEAALTEFIYKMKTGGYVEPSKEILVDFLRKWLETKTRISSQTRFGYEYIIKRIGRDGIVGKIPLGKLTAIDIEGYFARLRLSGIKENTIKKDRQMLQASLKKQRRAG